MLGTQIDGYPRTPADTFHVYLPISAFDETTCGQPGATAHCIQVGGVSNQPRNSFRYASSFTLDFALSRSIAIAGRQRAQVRLEFINLLNNHYAGTPNVSFARPDLFGRVTTTNGNRAWQIGVRYDW